MKEELQKFLEDHDLQSIREDLETNQITDLKELWDVAQQPDILKDIVKPLVARARLINASSKLQQIVTDKNPVEESNARQLTLRQERQVLLEIDENITQADLESVESVVLTADDTPLSKKRKLGDLRDFLQSSVEGRYLLTIGLNGTFDNSQRLRLTQLIINREFENDSEKTIDSKRFIQLANEIVEIFPDEYAETYYTPAFTPVRGKTVPSKGKLYDKYTHLCRDLRKAGLRKVRSTEIAEDAILAVPLPETGTNIDGKLEFLKSRVYPWETIQEYWRDTSAHRLNLLRKGKPQDNACDYFDTYPCLSKADGYRLLELDFKVQFPDGDFRLLTHWDKFASNVKKELHSKGVETQDSDVDLLKKILTLFSVVPVKTRGKRPCRASREEILDGFLMHVKDLNDIDREIDRIYRTAVVKETTVQPFPLVVGEDTTNITASFLVINRKTIPVESPRRAFEVAFKCYFALHCEYPVQSQRLWYVVQKTLFDIHTPWDRANPSANHPEVKRLMKVLQC